MLFMRSWIPRPTPCSRSLPSVAGRSFGPLSVLLKRCTYIALQRVVPAACALLLIYRLRRLELEAAKVRRTQLRVLRQGWRSSGSGAGKRARRSPCDLGASLLHTDVAHEQLAVFLHERFGAREAKVKRRR